MTSQTSWRTDKRTSTQRGYGSKWQKARATYLREHPLCAMCQREGMVVEASVVDHVTPHKGDEKLFWSRSNWQSLCKKHHDSDKQMLEKSGQERTKFTSEGRVIW